MEPTEGLILITFLVFSGSLLLVLGGYFYASHRRERSAVIKRIQQAGDSQTENEVDATIRTAGNRLMSLIRSLGKLAKPKDEEELSHLKKAFLRAGSGNPLLRSPSSAQKSF